MLTRLNNKSLGAIIAGLTKNKGYSAQPDNRIEDLQLPENLQIQAVDPQSQYAVTIPTVSCSNDDVFLKSHPAFLVAHLLCGYASDIKEKETNRLITHLNNCFRCFDTYCEVMRDYYLELNK